MRDEKNIFHYSVLPFDEFPTDPTPPSRETQQCALYDIKQQFIEYMEVAIRDPDPWVGIKIMVNAERILDSYTSEGFNMLVTMQAELQADLHKVWRMARRKFLRAALLSPAHEFPQFLAHARDPKLGLDGPDADADFDAVVRHLEVGGPLFDDLRKRDRVKLS